MRIAISGTVSIGKSTLINDFLKEWPLYKTPSDTYRSLIKTGNYPHSKKCNKEGQWAILNHMIDEMQKYSKEDKIIYDRCPWDNLVFSIWAAEMQSSDIDEEFVAKCIPIVKESMKFLDMICYIPITKHSPVPIVDNGFRETDPKYIEGIDNIFKALFHEYQFNLGKTPFFTADDSPAIIEIFGNPHERIALLQQYLNADGEVIGDDGNSILDPNNIEDLEKLLMDQMTADQKEKLYSREKQLAEEFLAKTKVS